MSRNFGNGASVGSDGNPDLIRGQEPKAWIPNSRLDTVAQALGDFAYLGKPLHPWTLRGRAELAATAGTVMRLANQEIGALRHTGCLHDLGPGE